MHIFQINTLDKKGGAAKVAYSLKKELEKRGHTTSMFVGRKYSDENNVRLLNDINSFSGKVRRKLAYWLADDIDVFSSGHILKTEEFKKADIIHCHNLHSNYFNLGTLEKISAIKPVVWTFHDMWPITAHCAHAFDGRMKDSGFFACPSLDIYPPIAWHNEKYLEKRKGGIYNNSKFHIVTPSKWLAGKVGQSALKDKPLSVIYNGIDISIFKPMDKQESRKLLGLPQDKRIILIVAKGGASNPWKGGNYAREAIEAFRSDSGAFFVNLGGNTGHDSPGSKTVNYTADQDTLARYYSAADMLLYPSIADNCPLVVLEALACGLPVVSFNTGGIPELVRDRVNGYIARYKDTADLISGVKYFLELDDKNIEQIRLTAVETVEDNFGLDLMVNNYISLYEKLRI